MFTVYCAMVTMSLMLMMIPHPVFIMISILAQTMLICLSILLVLSTSWFAFILFLIFLGGLMILFVYIVSLASNEKFEINYKYVSQLLSTLITIIFMVTVQNFFFKAPTEKAVTFFMKTSALLSENFMMPMTLVMFYLLFTLIVAVKISSKFEGPLRSVN